MKVTGVFILALLALSVAADGHTDDDWSEASDVQKKEGTFVFESGNRTESTTWSGLQEGDVKVGTEKTVTDGIDAIWKEGKTESRLEMQNGTLVNVTVLRKTRIDSHRKVMTVRRIEHKEYEIEDVMNYVREFGSQYGKPLSEEELAVFNAIAATEGNEFSIKYNVKQIKVDKLKKTLRHMAHLFSVQLNEDDINEWADEIANKCDEDKFKMFPLDTSAVETFRPDAWTVKTEILIATCGKGQYDQAKGYQIFAWSASKSGAFKRNQYSQANSDKVNELVTRWLYNNMFIMVDCKKDVLECSFSDSSTLEQFEPSTFTETTINQDLLGKDWTEHAKGSGDDAFRYYASESSFQKGTEQDWQEMSEKKDADAKKDGHSKD